MKSDTSIRNICVASIKRKTFTQDEFLLTRFFETELLSEIDINSFELLETTENELPIAQTIVDPANWTLVTTRQVISCIDGVIKRAPADKITKWKWGDFKGYEKTAFTVGFVEFDDQQKVEIFIETKKASMVIIYAVMTLTRLAIR